MQLLDAMQFFKKLIINTSKSHMFSFSRSLLIIGVSITSGIVLYGSSVQGQTIPTRNVSFQMSGTVQTAVPAAATIVTTLSSKARGSVLDGPQGITTDGTNLYVADSINNTISKVSISTGAVTRIAGSLTTQAWGYADGAGDAANFKKPHGITTDGTNLYVADTFNHVIRKIVISTGMVSTLAGRWSTGGAFGFADGHPNDSSFNSPRGLATDGTYLYVADTGNHTIRKITIATGYVTTLAGTPGVAGYADGIGAAASFNGLTGITTDGSNLYVADTKNNSLRKIVIATGAVTTLAGKPGASGYDDGIGANARFTGPHGVVTDGINVFVADSFNHTIRKMVIATGMVTTIAGVRGVSGKADGLVSRATFSRPSSLTNDGVHLYVADTQNGAIKIVE
jgi:sugar lactone lactonase YvrE